MNYWVRKKIGSWMLSAALALTAIMPAELPVVARTDDTATLSFQNEKYDGIKITKNIYSNEEFVKGKGNRTPIRETNPEPGDTYDINELRYDEFELVLYGAENKDDLYKASERPPLPDVKYQRKLGSLLYYHITGHKTENGRLYDLTLAPYSISDYYLYYSLGNGCIDIVFRSEDSFLGSEAAANSEDPAIRSLADRYTSSETTYHERFLMDGAYYTTSSGDTDKQTIFRSYDSAHPDFFTGTDGAFSLFDGDVAYFDKDDLNAAHSKYVRVKEQWQSIRQLNEERSQSPLAEQYTGEYIYMIDDDVVSDVIASSQSGILEIANRFDSPTHELVIGKTVPFFGVAPSDVNPFRTTDLFEYKLLINDRVPARMEYTLTDTKTNRTRPTAAEAGDAHVVAAGDEYHYVTTDGLFTLYAEETAAFYGVQSGDKVEIREYLDAHNYSVLSELSGDASFRYVPAADSTETPQRDYAAITVQYGNEPGQRRNPTFTNVPNVLQVRKRVDSPTIDPDIPFTFTIKKLLPDPSDPDRPYRYNGQYIVNSAFVTDSSGQPVVLTDDEGHPEQDSTGQLHYQTVALPAVSYGYYLRNGDNNFDPTYRSAVNGTFTLCHDQTAMFVNLEANAFYLVTETNTPAYNLLGDNPRVMHTRGATVDDPLIRSKSGNYYELFVNVPSEMSGIMLTKRVTDSDDRLNPQAEYTFRLEKKQNGTFVPAAGLAYQYKDGIGGYQNSTTDAYGYFKMRYNSDTFMVRFPKANGQYRVTEVDPNDYEDQNQTVGDGAPNPQKEDHLYITDVQYTEYVADVETGTASVDVEHPTETFNQDPSAPTRDVSVLVNCSQDRTAELHFTNRIREKTYYFDLEKLAYLDDNIHNGSADAAQRFLFRIERFQTMADALQGRSPLETFYTDLSCTEQFLILPSDSEPQAIQCYAGYDPYPYPFTPINFPSALTTASAQYEDGIVTREYTKQNTSSVYGNGTRETYRFLSSVYRGCRQLAVHKRGFYKVTEITEWSSTDYDYCPSYNRYKGYFDSTYTGDQHLITVNGIQTTPYDYASNLLFADYATTHTPDYDAANGTLERSVVIFVGALSDQSGPYTLGCEYFEQTQDSVPYIMTEKADQPIQQRDANGSLLYYLSGTAGQTTTEKYNEDGTRRMPVPAPDSDFRQQDTVIVNNTPTPLYFDAAHTQPVYAYAVDPTQHLASFITHRETVTEGEGASSTTVEQEVLTAFPVYDGNGSLIAGASAYRLKDEWLSDESLYAHTDHVWSEETVHRYRAEEVLRPLASFSNVENEYAFLSANAWADNLIVKSSEEEHP